MGILSAAKSECVGLIVRAITVVSKISNLGYVILIHQRYRGQTDRRTTFNHKTAFAL